MAAPVIAIKAVRLLDNASAPIHQLQLKHASSLAPQVSGSTTGTQERTPPIGRTPLGHLDTPNSQIRSSGLNLSIYHTTFTQGFTKFQRLCNPESPDARSIHYEKRCDPLQTPIARLAPAPIFPFPCFPARTSDTESARR